MGIDILNLISGDDTYANCVSLESGRHFNFTGVNYSTRKNLYVGGVYKMYFNGNGYNNLYLTGYRYLY